MKSIGTIKRENFDTMGIEKKDFQDKGIENVFNQNHSRDCPDLEKEMPLQM